MNARMGNDGDHRVSTLSGRTSCTRFVSADGVPARWAQIASASNVHGTNAPTKQRQVEVDSRPPDAAELVERARDQAGRSKQRGALPEPAALAAAGVRHE